MLTKEKAKAIANMWGLSSLDLYYVNQKGTKAGEFMQLSASAKIFQVITHYD